MGPDNMEETSSSVSEQVSKIIPVPLQENDIAQIYSVGTFSQRSLAESASLYEDNASTHGDLISLGINRMKPDLVIDTSSSYQQEWNGIQIPYRGKVYLDLELSLLF